MFYGFRANCGIVLNALAAKNWILNGRVADLVDAIELAEKYRDNRYLRDADCGPFVGPLSQYDELDFSEFLEIVEKQRKIDEQADINTRVKREASHVRRAEFNSSRPALVLAMIERGDDYVCSHPECAVADDLTVDHIVPLSKGGTDEVSNLQFLCRSHNSKKRDKMNEDGK